MLLPPSDEGRNSVQIAKRRATVQFQRAVAHAIEGLVGRADADPLHRQTIAVEIIGVGEVAAHRQRRARLGGQVRHLADMGYLFATGQNDRPAIFPCYGQQEGFTPDIVEVALIGAYRQEGRPPVPLLRLDQLGVPGGPNRIGPVGVHIPLGENGIVRIGEIGAAQFLRSQHDLGVIDAGAALGCSQIIIAILAENMRTFDPYRLFADVDAAIDQLGAGADHFAGAPVIFLNPDGAMPVIARRFIGRAIVHDIGFIPFPIDGWVDPFEG